MYLRFLHCLTKRHAIKASFKAAPTIDNPNPNLSTESSQVKDNILWYLLPYMLIVVVVYFTD